MRRVVGGRTRDDTRLSRRQAIGRMSVIATAGAAAWVVPEILTAKPAGGATLSTDALRLPRDAHRDPPDPDQP